MDIKKTLEKNFNTYSEYRKFFTRSMGLYKWDLDELEKRESKYVKILELYPEFHSRLLEEIEDEREYRNKTERTDFQNTIPENSKIRLNINNLSDNEISSLIQNLTSLLITRKLINK